MNNYWPFLIIPLIAAAALLAATPAMGQETSGTITGVVFDDFNGDGVQDEGEPGLPDKALGLQRDGAFSRLARTSVDGSYEMDGLEPGQYVLEVVLKESVGICADYPVNFNPLLVSWCVNFTFPWNATPAPVAVMVEGGTVVEIDLGAQSADVAVLVGVALLQDDRAAAGTIIKAMVGDQECGRTEVSADNEFNYGLHVLGQREREGCAAPGDSVRFLVGGVPATQAFTYVPFAQTPRVGYRVVRLVAIEDYAWYWFENIGTELPTDDVTVQALVAGVVCGEALLRGPWIPGTTMGISRLIVPSETIRPGCGRPGQSVSFRVGQVESATTVSWQPGLQRIELLLVGDVNCDLALNVNDALLLLQFEADLVQELACQDMADVNDDGRVDSIDAALILQFEAGLVESLPVSPA